VEKPAVRQYLCSCSNVCSRIGLLTAVIGCVASGEFGEAHEFSLYFMLPFIGVSLALLQLNWFVIT